jgi:hypothetical protein
LIKRINPKSRPKPSKLNQKNKKLVWLTRIWKQNYRFRTNLWISLKKVQKLLLWKKICLNNSGSKRF